MSIQVKVGGLYKCNCGGVWLAKRPAGGSSFTCALIGKYMADVIYERHNPGSLNLEQPNFRELDFGLTGILNSSLRFISEIEP